MTPSPWGRSPPPAPGCLDTPEYRWSLAASHPQLNQPGLSPHRQHPPGASSFSSPPSPPSAGQAHPHAHPITNRAAGLLPAGAPPPRELRVPRAGRGGTQKGAGLGERCHGRYTTGGARWGPGHPCSRSAALTLPAANVPLWRRSGRPWVLFGSVGTCGRASLASLHTGCWVGNAGVKILGV